MTATFDILGSPAVAEAVALWLPTQRWYADKGAPLARVRVREVLPFHPAGALVLWQAEFRDSPPSLYHVPLGVRPGSIADPVITRRSGLAVTDALTDPELVRSLVGRIAAGDADGPLSFSREAADLVPPGKAATVRPLGVQQSNSSVIVDDRHLLKIVRRPAPGVDTDLAVQRLLAAAGSAESPRLLGSAEVTVDGRPATLAVLQEYLPDARDGWTLAAGTDPGFVDQAAEIGRTVARLHDVLATHGPTAPISPQRARRIGRSMLDRLLPVADVLEPLLPQIRDRYTWAVVEAAGSGILVQRVHGDLHLGQLLRTPDRWLAVDFEGEPAATPAERTALHPVVKDIAGMLRSFDYRAFAGLSEQESDPDLRPRAQEWADRCRTAFLTGYAAGTGKEPLTADPLLAAYEIDKAVYEVAYERRNRPSWSWIPLQALARLLRE
ncbi:phosphotransferase [Micromonospora sp. WMMD714]|uniref:maltokinase N-terminal cap-like domain-containing protein n=1 Tax=Micromonospora sp. WMMD714 TaxID=3016097 RepID=UPI002499E291|nr:phosphotransferase [Micromonospora sp. WMMD714]WFE62827.1 phosphotransferase [Micromonospora sp. WMMD714]